MPETESEPERPGFVGVDDETIVTESEDLRPVALVQTNVYVPRSPDWPEPGAFGGNEMGASLGWPSVRESVSAQLVAPLELHASV